MYVYFDTFSVPYVQQPSAHKTLFEKIQNIRQTSYGSTVDFTRRSLGVIYCGTGSDFEC